jgi:diguanylate cyclase (GGDEF)-like protein
LTARKAQKTSMAFTKKHLFVFGKPIAWTASLTFAAVLAWQLLGRTADQLLARNAEATAVNYAHYVAEVTPGLAGLLEGRGLRDNTYDQLMRLRHLGDVFRFKLFDRNGRLVLVSDDIDTADAPGSANAAKLGSHRADNQTVTAIVLGGANYIEVKQGKGAPDRPDVYVEAYVPMKQFGRVIGVVEVNVDQTAVAARIRNAFTWVAGVIGALLLLLGSALALQVWNRLTERRAAADRMRYLAEHDMLSGALNRASFLEALQRAAWRHEQDGCAFSVLCIDLDRFKEVNDSLGHSAGDEVLRQVTERLRGLLRNGDRIARLGGDEFAVLQSSVRSVQDVAKVAERIVSALASPFDVNGQRVVCGASVGAARFGFDATSVDDLLHKVEVAMHHAKSSGRGRFSFYDAQLDRRLEERRTLARDLGDAIRLDTISLHYQALCNADGKSLLGYEALMRWKHAKLGMVPPAEFIPLAEETGQIEALGEWALHRACIDAAKWPAPLSVSVNLSAAQFRGEKKLSEVIARALRVSGLPPRRLVLEITESLLMVNTDSVVRTLEAIAAMGVQIAMDDFGTGYSSLSYLWRFPFNKVKIDRAFTQGLGGDNRVALIVRSIITLAHSMGIRVNAEGVETPAQMALLQRLGCDELQGYLLGRPLPLELLEHSMHAEPPAPLPNMPKLEDLVTQPMPATP